MNENKLTNKIRYILSFILVILVYRETGVWTALSILLTTITIEVNNKTLGILTRSNK